MLGNKLKNLKVLSFNWHEPYLCLLAETSHLFTIVEPEVKKGFTMRWRKELRPLPDNITLMEKETALSELETGVFDLAICQNAKDLIFIKDFLLPKILVCHNKLSTEIALGRNQVNREEYLASLRDTFRKINLVFISENKMKDWGCEGSIITPGIDSNEYRGYSGDIQKVLRVGNMIKERDLMMGHTVQEKILKDIPNMLMGENPTIPESRVSKNWEELKSNYVSHRLFLNTTVNQYEDGYNLAMLEAMATGMPVVCTGNDTSPIVNGENGFISDDIQYLREKIRFLFENRDEAKRIGQNGRKTVKENFSLEKFVEKWETVIDDTVKKFVRDSTTSTGLHTDKSAINKELQDILDKASQMQNENIEKAIEMYKNAESKFSESEELLLKLGACMLVTNQIEESEKYYKKAEMLNPNSSKSLTGLGFLEIQKGNLNVASDYFLKAITQDSSNDIAIYGEGICLWNKGEKKKGLQRYCEALDINIENMQVLTSLTEAVYALGSFEVVEKYFKEYLTLHPANLNMLFSLAGIQFKLGKIDDVRENLEKILVFDPTRNDAIQLMEIVNSQFKQGKTG